MSGDDWDNDYNNVAAYHEDRAGTGWLNDLPKDEWKFQKLGVELHNGTIDPIDDDLISLYKLIPGYSPFSGQKIVSLE